ncbi:RNA 2',3'-cyclic phosphodiesterase [Rhodoblastus sp.]|uniref:RNA 2',3'-cyclic phosphodiesterase n=1 Tax=Rhodoblastus sp. TaxID=1962975 RepID=UPI00262A95E2|nr:RNA 2',3'-cyclic phosphodiesterase [Rhodoblastus sp.]
MPRLFSAFEIPPDIAAQLAFFRGGLHGARWIDPPDYHFTLRFFGDVDARVAQNLAADLAETASFSGAMPLRLELDEIGVFGGRSPRTLYARVKSDPLLTRLQTAHEAIARRNGLAPEPRKFAPHVTLARLRGVSAGAVGVWLAERAFPLSLAFEANRFVLYSSRDSVGGGPYRIEAAYPFSGAGED